MSAFAFRATAWARELCKNQWVFPQGWFVTKTKLQNSCFYADATTVGNWCARIADPALMPAHLSSFEL